MLQQTIAESVAAAPCAEGPETETEYMKISDKEGETFKVRKRAWKELNKAPKNLMPLGRALELFANMTLQEKTTKNTKTNQPVPASQPAASGAERQASPSPAASWLLMSELDACTESRANSASTTTSFGGTKMPDKDSEMSQEASDACHHSGLTSCPRKWAR